MCTAISLNGHIHLFGRTLDVECSYGEAVIVTPRHKPLELRHEDTIPQHPAIIGIGCTAHGFPLYFDAANEHGLAAAGLNFPHEAAYRNVLPDYFNIASFELIPWLLSKAEDLSQARALLEKTNVTNDSFSHDIPCSALHFMISDKSGALVAEPTPQGIKLYDNPMGVMTNSPEFSFHLSNAAQYSHLTASEPPITDNSSILPFSKGFGAIGLPGDFSSASRFVRAVFAKNHTEFHGNEVNGFFHIADTVKVPRGCERNSDGKPSFTAYTCCIDTQNLVYHTATYDRREIRQVSLRDFDVDGNEMIRSEL